MSYAEEIQHVLEIDDGDFTIDHVRLPTTSSNKTDYLKVVRAFFLFEDFQNTDTFSLTMRLVTTDIAGPDLISENTAIDYSDLQASDWAGWIGCDFKNKLVRDEFDYKLVLSVSRQGTFAASLGTESILAGPADTTGEIRTQSPRLEYYVEEVDRDGL